MNLISVHTVIKHPLVFSQLLLHSLWLLTLTLTLPLSITQFMLALIISLSINGLTAYAVHYWLTTLQRFKPVITQLEQGHLESRFQLPCIGDLHEFTTALNGLMQHYQDRIATLTDEQQQPSWVTTVENLTLVMWEWDLEADTLQFSKHWQTLVGTDADSLHVSSQGWQTRLHPDDLHAALSALKLHLEKKSTFFEDIHRLRHQTGYYIWVWLRGKAFYRAQGDAYRIVGCYQEITAYKNHENTLLSRLHSAVNQPSQAVVDTLHLLETTSLTPQQQQQLSVVKHAVELMPYPIADITAALNHTIHEVSALKFSKIGLGDMLDDCIGLFAITAAKKQLSLISHLEANVPWEVKGDRIRLRHILIYLLSNALKFTTQGDIVLHVSVLEQQAKQVLLRFEVQDSGVGMTSEQYTQLHQTLRTPKISCGQYAEANVALGLHAVKFWVTKMGGEFGIHHSLKQGCRAWFTVSLPMAQDFSTEVRQNNPLAQRTVLVIEEQPRQRMSLIALLQRWNMQIIIADGLSVVTEQLPHLLTQHSNIDIALVNLAHSETLSTKALELVSSLACPIVGLTPLLDPANPDAAFADANIALPTQAGPYYGVSKPIHINLLKTILIQALLPVDAQPEQALSPLFAKPQVIPTTTQTNSVALTKQSVPHDTKPEAKSTEAELKILVVEDSPMNREVITDMLQRLHHCADMAENGQEALELYENNTYDLIFMDCEMPVMDGYTATRTIREREQQQQLPHTPIIALTAHAMMQHRQLTQAAGMDDHISKPLRLNVLRKVLEHWTAQKSAQQHSPSVISSPTEQTSSTVFPTSGIVHATPEILTTPPMPTTPEPKAGSLMADSEPSANPQFADMPALDNKALEVLRNVVGDDLTPFCQQFIDYAPKQAAILHDSLQQQDSEGLRRKAHQFKGESLQIGANRLAEVCKNIETHAQQGELADIANLLQLLDNEVQNVIIALQQVN